ncbi:MAG: US12 family protein [Candidatus Woesebacteria bacterium]|nr:MAG: US12 family protein [Candidatus Woesebacteria bacterium]
MNGSVWKRTGYGTMSKNLYVLSISAFTGFGIFVSMLVAQFTLQMELTWPFALIVLVIGIAGIFVAHGSDVPVVSLLGYMMVAVPYGALLGPLLNLYVPVSIILPFFITTVYVAVFGLVGAVIPDSLESWSTYLLGGLFVGLLGYFIIPIGGLFGLSVAHALTVWDWAIVVLFAAVIMYDFNRALRIPYTLDNSIDVALAIYLDWFNVFIRVLQFFGILKKND